ncbi:hypothetical protein GCM10010910_09160 [Microbacterium nanhaiense]|uniref:LysE type translocator n=1 Tax=Microbacterium nanhaiense TaxID=1301026 RepID=A0ABQ2MZB8_9MICO|nr:hypothetical protein GCM10010910_09160 [Microbacterium nanhaiense]
MFFLAFIPSFIDLSRVPLPQYLILVATVLAVDILVMWFVFALAAKPFRSLTRSRRGRRGLNMVFGALFLGVAALLLLV